jgi:hypothetical protein
MKGMPDFGRSERILLRTHDRKDIFEEHYLELLTNMDVTEVFDDAASVVSSNQGVTRAQLLRSGSSSSQSNQRSRSQFLSAVSSGFEGKMTPEMARKLLPRDTHFFETEAKFKRITVPIRIPMTVFDEDVGDVRLIH